MILIVKNLENTYKSGFNSWSYVLDQNIALFFWGLKGSLLYDIFNVITGKVYILITCLPFIIIAFINLKKMFLIYIFTALIALSVSDILCYRVLKPSIKRLRPVYELKLAEQKSPDAGIIYSMPSNHAANITAFFIVYFFMIKKFWSVLLTNSILISLSRIIIVKHYMTDVIAGIAVGLLIGLTAIVVVTKIQRKYFYTDE